MSEPPREDPSAPAIGDVRVVEFEPRWRSDFARLNIEWIERWFSVEPADRELLDDPEGHVSQAVARCCSQSTRVNAR